MKNTIRCCISCILPCGVLDVIRIVHSNGHVEEISGSIRASEIMRAYPNHVLKKPSSPPCDDVEVVSGGGGVVSTKIVVVPPDAELQRGKIYFLMPVSDAGKNSKKKRESCTRQHHRHDNHCPNHHRKNSGNYNKYSKNNNNFENNISLLIPDQYLSEILSEKISTQRDRRRGRVGVWRPHLESICETQNDDLNGNV